MPVLLGSIYNDRLKRLSRNGFVYDMQTDGFIQKEMINYPSGVKSMWSIPRVIVHRTSKKTFINYLKDKKLFK